MKKKIKEYQDKYGNIPNDFSERFNYIIEKIKPSIKDYEKVKKSLKKLRKIKWENIDFIFYFFPQATSRPRLGRKRVFYVKNAKNHSDIFKEFIEESSDLHKIITTSCIFYCDLFLPIPETISKVEKILAELRAIRPISKPDWDNAGKTYSDMVQKYLILDDSLIIDARVRKFYSFKPRIEIHIEYMENYDSKFNKKKIEVWKSYIESVDKIEEKDSII